MKKYLLITGLLVFLFTGCKNVLDKKVNVNTFKQDLAEIQTLNKGAYDKQDIRACNTLLQLCTISPGKSVPPVTYREMLDKIKATRMEIKLESKK